MFTIRNLGGVALLLFGTTFLWLTTSFVSPGLPRKGFAWSVTNVLAFAAMAGFTVATWGLFKRYEWCEQAAIASAVVGVAVLVPYGIAARAAGETNPGWNIFVHALGDVGVGILLLVPPLERWVNGHVMGGR